MQTLASNACKLYHFLILVFIGIFLNLLEGLYLIQYTKKRRYHAKGKIVMKQNLQNHKLLSINQETTKKYLNLYVATYELPNKNLLPYEFASRKAKENLVLTTNNHQAPDAVKVLPYEITNGVPYIIMIKEFRHALNDYMYALPAGLVDENEKPEQAAKRELLEEIGATTHTLVQNTTTAYTSPGAIDESLICFTACVTCDQPQQLEETEDIAQIVKLTLDQAQQQVDTCPTDLATALLVKNFILSYKLQEKKK